MIIEVSVKASAKVDEIKETSEGHFKVRVKDIPEHGKANVKVIKLIAERLNIPRSRIRLKRGGTSKKKLFEIN